MSSIVPDGAQEVLRTRFGIDPRALGAFRLLLGTTLLADVLLLRWPGAETFYSDAGVYPRSLHADLYPALSSWSLSSLSGSVEWQLLVLSVTAIVAVALAVGVRSRSAGALSIVLVASLWLRNPFVVNGGDVILLLLLFFGTALPLDARFALATARRSGGGPRDEPVVSLRTAALLGMVWLIYATNAAFKYLSEAWLTGATTPQVFHIESLTVLVGPVIAEYPTVLMILGYVWMALLTASVVLPVLTGWRRTALVAGLAGAHLGMAATMRLGTFPFVMVTALVVFLPPSAWDRLERSFRSVRSRVEQSSVLHTWPGSLSIDVPAVRLPRIGLADRFPRVGRVLAGSTTAVLVAVLVTLTVWQAAGVGVIDVSTPDGSVSPEDRSLAMFAPNPPASDHWLVVRAERTDGTTVDPLRNRPVRDGPPPNATMAHPTTLWHRYGNDIGGAGAARIEAMAQSFCRRSDDPLERVTVRFGEQPVDPDGVAGPPTVRELGQYDC